MVITITGQVVRHHRGSHCFPEVDLSRMFNSFRRKNPFQRGDQLNHQQGFAHFGGPHILSLVTE